MLAINVESVKHRDSLVISNNQFHEIAFVAWKMVVNKSLRKSLLPNRLNNRKNGFIK